MTHSPLKPTKKRVTASDKLSGNFSELSVRAMRTPVHGVEVVTNKNGTYINLLINGSPSRCFGPLDGPMSIEQALVYVGTVLSLKE